jgi:putative protease
MGKVARVSDGAIVIEPGEAHSIVPLKAGDGVVFDAADWRSPEEPEEGGRVFEVVFRGRLLEVRFGNGVLNTGRIRRGDLMWRTHDPELDKAVRPYSEAVAPVRRQPVSVRVVARAGERLVTEWRVGAVSVAVRSEAVLGEARNRGLDSEFLREQLGRLGNTPYELVGIEVEAAGSPFAPASLLNQVRREAVERLQEAQGRTDRSLSVAAQKRVRKCVRERVRECVRECVREPRFRAGPRGHPERERSATLHLLVRTSEQLDAALELRPASVTLDYLDLYGLKPSLQRVRAAGLEARVASPRVLKPGEERIADFLLSCDCPILVRSAGLLESLRGKPHAGLIGDFSLNAANVVTAEELLHLGLELLTPTHDLNAEQVSALARAAGADRIEAIAYQHLPVFHTEHCVFCRFLSTGTSYRDCGRPCEQHRVALRDTAGRAHPVMADVGCRNTVFGAEAQQAGAHLESWLAAGIRRFRLEFAHESGEQVTRVTRAFEDVLAGRAAARDLSARLGRLAPFGITEGSLYVPEGYLTLPVLQ